MKHKSFTLDIRRARSEKMRKMYYYGYLLPMQDGLLYGHRSFDNN